MKAMMVMRGSFVLALILGLGKLVGIWSFAALGLVHILLGVIMLGAMVAQAVAGFRQKAKTPISILGGALLGIVGAIIGLRAEGELARGMFHLAAMVMAIGGVEAGVARLRRT